MSVTSGRANLRGRVLYTSFALSVLLYAATIITPRTVFAAPSAPGTINLFAGGDSGGVGGSPLNAVVQPSSVAVDSTRHIMYIGDIVDDKVFEVMPGADGVIGQTNSSGQYTDTDDTITVLAGTGVDGSGSKMNSKALGDGGPATGALLSSPDELAVDVSGNVYIGDFGDNRVRFVCQTAGGCVLPWGGESAPQG